MGRLQEEPQGRNSPPEDTQDLHCKRPQCALLFVISASLTATAAVFMLYREETKFVAIPVPSAGIRK